jgi:cytochrome P450
MKWEWNLGFSNYTESFRRARKVLDRSLRPATIATYRPLLQTKAHVLLTHVLTNPDELDAHFHQFVPFLWLRTVSPA